jgi:adenylyltransferase/sulfurtransferase
MFHIQSEAINREFFLSQFNNFSSGALIVFEGLVRNHNEGKQVKALEYQIYFELALKEGQKIIQEAKDKFHIHEVFVIHREGYLELGEVAICIGVTSSHRDESYKASRYVIDQIKFRLPIWKKEHYTNQGADWVFCKDHIHHVHFNESDYYQKQRQVTNQMKLKNSHVLIVGVGGLGCQALMNLASAGVGEITIVDDDKISISNLHRQPLYSMNQIGEYKVDIASRRMQELNPFIKINSIKSPFDQRFLERVEFVLDCTDNLRSKFFIHDSCLSRDLPFITASIYKTEGVVRTVNHRLGCFRCYLTEQPEDSRLGNCNDVGVLGAHVSLLGSLQASEAIEYLVLGKNISLQFSLYVDLTSMTITKIKNARNQDCLFCQNKTLLQNDYSLEVTKSNLNPTESVLIDIRSLTDDEIKSSLNSQKMMILYCHRGNRSLGIVKELRKLGFENVFSLQGGACSL